MDERSHTGAGPPAAVFSYSSDRKGERPVAHLKYFIGVLHADRYAGFNGLYERPQAGTDRRGRLLGPCPPEVLRVHAAANQSEIAKEALD